MVRTIEGQSNGVIIIEGHVQGLSNVRTLGERGIPVIVLDRYNCIARYSKYCRRFFRCPEYTSSEFVDFLMELAEKYNLKNWILIPSNDHALLSIVNNRPTLENRYNLSTLSSADTIGTIYDKVRLLALAKKENILFPLTYNFEKPVENVPETYPVLIKGRNGLSFYRLFGCKAFIASSKSAYNEILNSIRRRMSVSGIFAQEVIPDYDLNPTVSFTAFAIRGEMTSYWIGEKLRQHPLQFGTATFCRSIDIDSLVEPSQSLLKALNYTGVCEIEYLLDPRDNEYKLIEINARTWLWVGLAKACGVAYASMLYDFAHGNTIHRQHGSRRHFKWINFLTDTPYSILALLKGKLKLKSYICSFRGKIQSASFSWKDLKPSALFPLILILYSGKRKHQNN